MRVIIPCWLSEEGQSVVTAEAEIKFLSSHDCGSNTDRISIEIPGFPKLELDMGETLKAILAVNVSDTERSNSMY